MALDLTTFSSMLKELYTDQVIANLVYKDNPFAAMVKKADDFYGKSFPVPIVIGAAQGVATSITLAKAAQANIETEAFNLTRKRKFKIASIDNETADASSNDKGAFLDAMKAQIDGAFVAIKNDLATELYGDGTGVLATLDGNAGAGGTGVLTLANPNDVVRFERNMVLSAYPAASSTARAGDGYVIAVDRMNGTVTVATSGIGGAAATPTAWEDTDRLVIKGNLGSVVSGLSAWLTTPGSGDNFFGVDRTVDSVRLAGVVADLSELPIVEAFNRGALYVVREGGSPTHAFCSYGVFNALLDAMGSKVQYTDLKGPANITFEGVKLPTPKGIMKVVPDRNCPDDQVFMLSMDHWWFKSLGKTPKYIDNDSLTLLRDPDSNAVTLRLGYYGNLYTNAPGWNGKFKVAV